MVTIRKIWQAIKDFFLNLFTWLGVIKPAAKRGEKSHYDTDYEAIFLRILDGVYQGWNQQKIIDLLTEKNIDEKDLNKWLEKFGDRLISSPTLHQELADRMLIFNQVYGGKIGENAAQIAQQLLTQKPEQTTIYLETANEKFNEGNWLEAVKDYDKILALKPEHTQALLNKGICLDELGEKAASLDCFDQILNRNPQDHQAWYNKGINLGSIGQIEAAIACFEKVIQLQPEDHQAWFNKAIGLAKLNQYHEAIKAFAKMVEIKPNSYGGWYHYAIVLEALDRKEDAINCYDQAIKIKPNSQEAINKKQALLDGINDKIT